LLDETAATGFFVPGLVPECGVPGLKTEGSSRVEKQGRKEKVRRAPKTASGSDAASVPADPRVKEANLDAGLTNRDPLDPALFSADGERLGPEESDLVPGVEELVERNPMLAVAASLVVGLIAGMLIGAAVARD